MLDRATFRRPIAHRGLHRIEAGIVENTEPAFAAAMARGYGIECDLQPALGGEPMVFHDAMLGRLTDTAGAISSLTPAELKSVAFKATPARMQTFAELLEQVAGRVPLVVEIKSDTAPDAAAFKARIAGLAGAYKGPIALKSFDPYIIVAMRQLAPTIPRGLVSGGWRGPGWHEDEYSGFERFALRHLMLAPRAGASFISYDIKAMPAPAPLLLRRLGRFLMCWTVRTPEERAHAARYADAMVFEGFEP